MKKNKLLRTAMSLSSHSTCRKLGSHYRNDSNLDAKSNPQGMFASRHNHSRAVALFDAPPPPAVEKTSSPPSTSDSANMWLIIGVVVPLLVVVVIISILYWKLCRTDKLEFQPDAMSSIQQRQKVESLSRSRSTALKHLTSFPARARFVCLSCSYFRLWKVKSLSDSLQICLCHHCAVGPHRTCSHLSDAI